MKPIGGTDIISGLIAAAAFLAMVFGLGMELWLSVVLAVAVYAGIRLATSTGSRDAAASLSEADLIRRIELVSRPVANPRVQERVAAICAQARAVLAFFEQHPEKGEAWRGILRECLESTLRIVERYVELSRFFEDPNRHSLQEMEALLDQVAATFANLRGRLVDEGAADLSAEMAQFRSTLQALDEVNVMNRGGETP